MFNRVLVSLYKLQHICFPTRAVSAAGAPYINNCKYGLHGPIEAGSRLQ